MEMVFWSSFSLYFGSSRRILSCLQRQAKYPAGSSYSLFGLGLDLDFSRPAIVAEKPLPQNVAANETGEERLANNRARDDTRRASGRQPGFRERDCSRVLRIFSGLSANCIDFLVPSLFELARNRNLRVDYRE